jgi:hypothetical protein
MLILERGRLGCSKDPGARLLEMEQSGIAPH